MFCAWRRRIESRGEQRALFLFFFLFFFCAVPGKTSHWWAFYQRLSRLTRGAVYLHAATYQREATATGDRGGVSEGTAGPAGFQNGSREELCLPRVKYWRGHASALMCAETLMQSQRTCLKSTLFLVRQDKKRRIKFLLYKTEDPFFSGLT